MLIKIPWTVKKVIQAWGGHPHTYAWWTTTVPPVAILWTACILVFNAPPVFLTWGGGCLCLFVAQQLFLRAHHNARGISNTASKLFLFAVIYSNNKGKVIYGRSLARKFFVVNMKGSSPPWQHFKYKWHLTIYTGNKTLKQIMNKTDVFQYKKW